MKTGVVEWLSGRLWRGNYDEFCAYLRQVIMECPSREISMAYLTTREAAFAGRPAGSVCPPPPLTTTTSMDTTVATANALPVKSTNTTSPFGQNKSGRMTAKELLATLR